MATLKITLAMAIEAIKAIFGLYGRIAMANGSYKVAIIGPSSRALKN